MARRKVNKCLQITEHDIWYTSKTFERHINSMSGYNQGFLEDYQKFISRFQDHSVSEEILQGDDSVQLCPWLKSQTVWMKWTERCGLSQNWGKDGVWAETEASADTQFSRLLDRFKFLFCCSQDSMVYHCLPRCNLEISWSVKLSFLFAIMSRAHLFQPLISFSCLFLIIFFWLVSSQSLA